jgi:hypothetical protein
MWEFIGGFSYAYANEQRVQLKLAAGQPLTWRDRHYVAYLFIWLTIGMYLAMSLVFLSLRWPLQLGGKTYHRPSGLTPSYCKSLGGFWDGALCEPNDNWSPTRDRAKVQQFENDPLIKAQNAQ